MEGHKISELQVRRLQPEDADAYFKIRLEALKNNPEAFGSSYEEESGQSAEKYKERFAVSDSFTFGAFDGSRLVGTITLLPEKMLKLQHRATIFAMYVMPEKRGSGIGKLLMETAIKTAHQLEAVEQIHLTVVSTNEPAIRLYQSMGFKRYGIEQKALKVASNYFDEDLMVLFL